MRRPDDLVTGAAGQVGLSSSRCAARRRGAADRAQLDLADPTPSSPRCAARGRRLSSTPRLHRGRSRGEGGGARGAVNARAPGISAEEAKRAGAVLIHYSTDYVFDGARITPYPEDAPAAPLNVYGATKLDGERAIAAVGGDALVFRTSWVYGLRGRNFLLTIRRLAAERDELRIVADQIGVPNWCRVLAEATARSVAQGCPHSPSAPGSTI
jgi:dTDP-4-dehydrorhamnose reductase